MDMFFQSYYPSLLSNWWCDDWITTVYGVERTTKHEGVEVYHHTFVSRYDFGFFLVGGWGWSLKVDRALFVSSR